MSAILILLASQALASEAIRGVGPELAAKYAPDADGNFHCLNSSVIIPWDKVNDNYCDCPDGSDEPGTSACEQAQFYCANEGFKPGYIPSAWVDDGVCDYERCCDGSDESDGHCPNRCKELAVEYETKRIASNAKVEAGLVQKEAIHAKSVLARKTVEAELAALREENAKQQKVLEALKKKREAEESEAQKAIDGAFAPSEQSLKNLESQISEQQAVLSSYKSRLAELENILEKVSNDYNPNFNDHAVKLAAKSFQDYSANNKLMKDVADTDAADAAGSVDVQGVVSAIGETKHTLAARLATADSSDATDASPKENRSGLFAWLPSLTFEDVWDSFLGHRSGREVPESEPGQQEGQRGHRRNRGRAAAPPPPPPPRAGSIEDLEQKVQHSKKEIHQREKELTRDYGPDDILRSKKDCIMEKISGYNYRLCWTDKLTQIDSNNKAVRIGNYESMTTDELTNTVILRYGGGEKCWNGPLRGAEVHVKCGVKEKLVSVSEPVKCHYMIMAESPLGCSKEQLY